MLILFSCQVSSGAIDMAKSNLDNMLRVCNVKLENASLIQIQEKALFEVISELVRQITSPHTIVREEVLITIYKRKIIFKTNLIKKNYSRLCSHYA